MKLLILLLLCMSASAQNVNFAISWVKSETVGASNVIYLSRAPSTNLMTAFRFPVGTNILVRAVLNPGVWNLAVRSQHASLESAPALLTFTVPGPVSGLGANIIQ